MFGDPEVLRLLRCARRQDADAVERAAGAAQLTWHAVDTSKYNVNLYHFAGALGNPTSCSGRSPSSTRRAIGSNAASVWWINGEEVIGLYNDRQAVIDDT